MINFILNNDQIETDQPSGSTVLDFVRYHKNLKGTKIGCREGDCGACTVLVGELANGEVKYRTMTSCLMPLANAAGKHIVTVEGINPEKRGMTPVQQAMVDESGTQCGFCTVGFVMSLTGFCIDDTAKTPEMAVSAIDGNICRCTGYKSIERAAIEICDIAKQAEAPELAGCVNAAIENAVVPKYFNGITERLRSIITNQRPPEGGTPNPFVGGGTDLYVQKHDAMVVTESRALLFDDALRGICDTGTHIEIGASATVTDLMVSPVMQAIFPDLYKHLKLVSSTPIRNMATLAGNFVNASPIGDMTVWFLALDAEIDLCRSPHVSKGVTRKLPLKDLYLGYKKLAKSPDEQITQIRFRKPTGDFRFNFEKVCKRTYLDIATVNTAISLSVRAMPGESWLPPALSEPGAIAPRLGDMEVNYTITEAHVAAGGVSPIPLYLKETSAFLGGKLINEETIAQANEIIQSEISPISDVRGTEQYKRLLLRQLFTAHFIEMQKTVLQK
ncbi:xanthine dehydrogenase small subunit [soil metagenome]